MLSDRALKFYNNGYNCAQCILKACEEEYSVKISEELLNSCNGLYNGLGVGGCCGVIIASIMVIGILCDNVPFCRLEMVERFNKEFSSLNCCQLKKKCKCDKIIIISCDILSDIIDKEKNNY